MATRRQYSGSAPATVLQTAMTSGTPATINVSAGTGANYPDGSVGPFFIVIDRGLGTEEKILITSRSTDTFTISARGQDGTSASSHTSGTSIIEHVVTKTDLDEANAHVSLTTQDDHTQYIKTDGSRAFTGVAQIANVTPTTSAPGDAAAIGTNLTLSRSDHKHGREAVTAAQWVGHTFTVAGDVAVPSGDLDFINPIFIPVAAGRTVKLAKCRYKINGGTSVTCKLQINGSDATGFTGISVTTTTAETDPTNISMADGDRLALVVTAVSGSPKNLSFTVVMEHA
jgi:hypothetical protein